MEEKISFLEPLFERAEIYGNTRYELFKLKALDKVTDIVSTIVSRGAAFIALMMFLITINIAVALWLGDILGKLYYGFFCVAGFYGVLGTSLYFVMHDIVKKRVGNSFISQMLN